MTMSAAPIASGGMTPAPPPITVSPMVRTRKKVPMNSAMYFFICLVWGRVPPSVLVLNVSHRHAFSCARCLTGTLTGGNRDHGEWGFRNLCFLCYLLLDLFGWRENRVPVILHAHDCPRFRVRLVPRLVQRADM